MMKMRHWQWLVVGLIALVQVGRGEFLRGFGDVAATRVPGGMAFTCESPEMAVRLLHKLARDLEQTATVPATWREPEIGGRQVPVLVRDGLGAFLPTATERVVTVYTAADVAGLQQAAGDLAGAAVYDADYRYPAYLDKYSRYGIGCWYPSNWGDANSKDKPNDVDDHFAFAREMDLVLQPNSEGYLLRNLLPKLHEYGRPYHFVSWQEWSPEIAIMAPEELIATGPQFSSMPHYYGQISDGGHRLMTYHNWQMQERIRRWGKDPLVVDWPDPNGEVGPHGEDFYWDFSESNRLNFVRYLRDVRGYTLAGLGEAWRGDPESFRGWDDVTIPMTYELFGWAPDSIAADRAWRLHPAPGDALEIGLEAGWEADDFDDSGWVTMPAPGGELIATFWRANSLAWHRGTLEVPAAWLEKKRAAGPVYLAAVTFTSARGPYNPDRVWLNGREVAAWSHCGGYSLRGQFDVSDMLRPGRNVIAYLPAHNSFHGTFFLTDVPFEEYPFADPHRNARYVDWNEYVPWAVADMLENTFKAIRGVDPNRFIKMHAYRRKDLGIPLAARYGCFGHNTGDEAFFRPWDRRFGYVRGIPSSAEPSGSVDNPAHFKRWLGWHCFTGGPNALDYFHNIQSMMYSPCAELWQEYMTYWKLGPRRVLKKPELALFWSSLNNFLLPRPVPYCNDLGRGDLQAIGYSYVYVDESAARDDLLADYPVVWDTGTWVMDTATVGRLRAYVEAGGTFVALQETGRHTLTQRDTWPIAELTGFRVGEVRGMTGTLSILTQQPLFTKLAGKVYYNRGKSIDYSDYNYADKCVALEPVAPDTQVIARYDDGAIAIGMRTLGKGRVIVLGSPFWRDSYDQAGMWWPGDRQNAFLMDLLPALGVHPVATAAEPGVWREHYLAMNGTEEFLILHNPGDEARTYTGDWTAVNPAGALFDPKDGTAIPGTVNGRDVHFDGIALAPRETLIVATQPRRDAVDAVTDWYAFFARYWRQAEGGSVLDRPDLPLYELRLAPDLYGKVLTPPEAAALPAVPAGATLGACQSPEEFEDNPDANRRCVFHISFPTPATWQPDDRVILWLRGMSHAVGDIVGPVDAWVNDTQVLSRVSAKAEGYSRLQGGASADIGGLLRRDADNVLVFTTGPHGFEGEVDVQMRPAPAEVLTVAGTWQVQHDPDSGLSTVELPGRMEGMYAYTTFDVPAAWQGDRIFVDLDLDGPFDAFAINEKMVFHPVNWFPAVYYMDVTPWVACGQPNRLTLITRSATRQWQPGTLDVRAVRIQRVPANRK